MNKLLVVAKNPETYFIKRLIEEVGHKGVAFYNPWSDAKVEEYFAVLVRTSGVYQSEKDLKFLEACGKPILNPLTALKRFRSKSSQYEWFNRAGHPCLPWAHLSEWVPSPGNFLVKPDFGQGGWGIQVFEQSGMEEFCRQQILKNDLSWIVQPYVVAPEYRVFFVGDDRWVLKRRPSADGLAANFAQEGEAEVVAMPAHLAHVVDGLIMDSEAYYGAIDLLDLPSGPIILELNVIPGIEQLESLTGFNIMKHLLTANFFCQIR